MRWQRIVIGSGQSLHPQAGLESRFSWNENLQRSKNRTAESTNLKEHAQNAGYSESVFVIRKT